MHTRLFVLLLILCAVSLFAHCGGILPAPISEQTDASLADGGADDLTIDNSTGGSTAVDTDFPNKPTDSSTEICAAEEIPIAFVPTRLVMLLDLSLSMKETVAASPGPSKWSAARNALTKLLKDPTNAAIEFGLDGFPVSQSTLDDSAVRMSCQVPTHIVVDAGPAQQATIVAALKGLEPNGATPLCKAMTRYDPDQYADYAPKFMTGEAARYLLIVSDGADTCGDPDHPALCGAEATGYGSLTPAELLRDRAQDLQNHGVLTYVIGFGAEASMTAQLNAIAGAGGTERETYINVDDGAGLQAALGEVTAKVASCVFTVQKPGAQADPEQVNFRLDDRIIPRDDACAQDGWRWALQSDPGWKVEFCGASCAQIKAGDASRVAAEFGCPTVVVPRV